MKKKIVILGCENSHAAEFLRVMRNDPSYDDVEVVGIYSNEEEAMKKLSDEYGVHAMASPDEAAGKVDGVIITARHGGLHLPYALPYFRKNQVMFIDKPITIDEGDAVKLASLLKENDVKFCGGSSLKHEKNVVAIAEKVKELKDDVLGGFVRCPIDFGSPYGNFYFYAQHLVETVCEIYGRFPNAVRATRNGKALTVVFRYENYDVVGQYADHCYAYSVLFSTTQGTENTVLSVNESCYKPELDEFCALLRGAVAKTSLTEFFSSVYIMNAIDRSMKSGIEEPIGKLAL